MGADLRPPAAAGRGGCGGCHRGRPLCDCAGTAGPRPVPRGSAWRRPRGVDRRGRGASARAAPGSTARPAHARLLALDRAALEAVLAEARPLAGAPAAAGPRDAGAAYAARGLAALCGRDRAGAGPTLAAQFPAIQTYRGRGLDDPAASVRLGLTAQGLHAVILSSADTVYITPQGAAPSQLHLSYFAARLCGRRGICVRRARRRA